MRLNVEVYIGDLRLDLFDDEIIEMNRTVKDFRELDKVFSDYTQSFTIPASKNNNIAMSHWYDESIATGFNPAAKKAARIEINTLPFRDGYLWLKSAVLKNGSVDYYEVEFFSEMPNILESFGKDTIPQLGTLTETSNFKLTYDEFDDGIKGTLGSGNKLIPLITSQRNWNLQGRGNGIFNSINYKPYSGQRLANGDFVYPDNRLTVVPYEVTVTEGGASFYDRENNWFNQVAGVETDVFIVGVQTAKTETWEIKVRDADDGFAIVATITSASPTASIVQNAVTARKLAFQFSDIPVSDFRMVIVASMRDGANFINISNSYQYAAQGGMFYELKPALKADFILEQIESKYSVSFTGGFWNSDAWQDMYMWSNRAEGFGDHFKMDYVQLTGGSKFGGGAAVWDLATGVLTVPANSGDVTVVGGIKVRMSLFEEVNEYLPEPKVKLVCTETTGTETSHDFVYLDGGSIQDDYATHTFSFPDSASSRTFKFYVKSNFPEKFDWAFASNTANLNFTAEETTVSMDDSSTCEFRYFNHTYTDSLTNETINIEGGLPDQNIAEWLQNIIKMFNLVILPINATTFQVETFDDWMALGSEIDITKYVAMDNVDVQPASLYNELKFSYAETETVLGKNYAQLNGGIGYGDSITEIRDSFGDAISSQNFELKVPFENPSWSRLTNFAPTSDKGGFLSELMVCHYINSEFSTTGGQTVMFYSGAVVDLEPAGQVAETAFDFRSFYINGAHSDIVNTIREYNLCFQYNDKDSNYTQSLNFGAEVNPFTLATDTASSPSIFKTFWEDYITDLYDLSMRRTMVRAILPLNVILEIEVNDVLTISTKKYTINNMKLNLTTGEAAFELLTLVE